MKYGIFNISSSFSFLRGIKIGISTDAHRYKDEEKDAQRALPAVPVFASLVHYLCPSTGPHSSWGGPP
jgi:hypothetical protein